MADTNRTLAAILALLADNAEGEISAQDLRDAIISVFANYALIGVAGGSTAQNLNATPGTFDKVTGFTTDGLAAGAVAADAANDRITPSVDGVYLIIWALSASGTADSIQEGRIYVNGGAIALGRWQSALDAAGAKRSAVAVGIATVAAGQHIECYAAADGGSDAFTPAEMTLAAIKIG